MKISNLFLNRRILCTQILFILCCTSLTFASPLRTLSSAISSRSWLRPLTTRSFHSSSSLSANSPSVKKTTEVQELVEKTQTASPHEFSAVMQSLVKIKRENSGLRLSEPSISTLLHSASQNLKFSTPRNLSQVIHTLGVLGITPHTEYLHAWTMRWRSFSSSTSPRQSNLRVRDLVQSLYGFALMGKSPGTDFLNHWEFHANQLLNEEFWDAQALTNTLFAYILLELDPQNIWKNIETHFSSNIQEYLLQFDHPKTEASLHQLHLIRGTLKYRYGIKLPAELNARIDQQLSLFQKRPPTESNTQLEILRELQNIYKNKIQSEAWCPYTASYVDFYLPDKKLIVQFNGPHHYHRLADGTEVLRPTDRLKQAIQQATGMRVVHISYREWDAMKSWTNEQRYDFWVKKIGLAPLVRA